MTANPDIANYSERLFSIGHIPEELRTRAQWVLWRREMVDGRLTKVPCLSNGRRASSTDAATWASFSDARKAYATDPRFDGIGFVFTADDPFVGIDLDHVLHDGVLDEWAVDVVRRLDSYTEISPGGDGLHIFVRADLPAGGNRRNDLKLELYDRARYFTVTGMHYTGAPLTINARQGALDAVHAQYITSPQTKAAQTLGNALRRRNASELSDCDFLKKARTAKNGAKFAALYDRGETASYGGDDSSADLALCSLLAFWLNADADRMDAAFRQSALMREKWDSRRGEGTYGRQTIERAIANCREVYDPRGFAMANVTRLHPTIDHTGSALLSLPTELEAATLFVKQYGDDLRYCSRLGGWLVWDGRRWVGDQDEGVLRMADACTRSVSTWAATLQNPDEAKCYFNFAISLQKRRGLENVVAIAQHQANVAIGSPDRFNTDPLTFNVKNGTIDLRTGELRPHSRGELLTKIAPIEYDQSAQAPRWAQFLTEIFNGNSDTIAFVQRAVGYSLTGDAREQCLFILHGNGANGKSCFLGTLKKLFGDYASGADMATFVGRKAGGATNDLARLHGARLVSATESNEGAPLAEGLIKAITGADVIAARYLFREFFDFVPTFKLWLGTNHKPIIRGSDFAIWRRVRLVPFEQCFQGERCDAELATKLESELPGILNWAIAGCLAWQKHTLGTAASVTTATQSYRSEMDTFATFLEECCSIDCRASASAGELFTTYRAWAESCGEKPITRRGLGMKLNERGFEVQRTTGGKRVWQGVGVATMSTESDVSDA